MFVARKSGLLVPISPIAYLGSTVLGPSGGTISAVNIGAANANRNIVVAISTGSSGAALPYYVNSVSIGGNAASLWQQNQPSSSTSTLFQATLAYLNVPTGTTADIVVSASSNGCVASVYSVLSSNSTPTLLRSNGNSANTSSGGTPTLTIGSTAGGGIICACTSASAITLGSGITTEENVTVLASPLRTGAHGHEVASGSSTVIASTGSVAALCALAYAA